MSMNSDDGTNPTELDQLTTEITTGAHGDDEQLRAFQRAIQIGVNLPCDAFVIGEPVSVVAFDYDGNQRRGLVARCQREDGSEHVVAAAEVVLAPRSRGIHYGLCLWRLLRFDETARVFDRMLWFNPSDNQGVRFLIDEVRARAPWEDRREK